MKIFGDKRINDLHALYQQGPWPAVEVQEFPLELLELLHLIDGVRVDEALRRRLALYERLRAFLAYQGVEMTAALWLAQVQPSEPPPAAPAAPQAPGPQGGAPSPRPPGAPPALGGIDPFDLGSD